MDAMMEMMHVLMKRMDANEARAEEKKTTPAKLGRPLKKFEERDANAHQNKMQNICTKISKGGMSLEADFADLVRYAQDIDGIKGSGEAFRKKVVKAYNDAHSLTLYEHVIDALRVQQYFTVKEEEEADD